MQYFQKSFDLETLFKEWLVGQYFSETRVGKCYPIIAVDDKVYTLQETQYANIRQLGGKKTKAFDHTADGSKL